MAEMADRDANRVLRKRFDDVFGQYQRLRSGLDDVQRRLAELRVSAESGDGMIKATVDARGRLVDLRISHRGALPVDNDRLSREILVTVSKAAAQATDEVRELMATCLPADSPGLDFLRDNDFGTLLRRSDRVMRESGDA